MKETRILTTQKPSVEGGFCVVNILPNRHIHHNFR